MARSSLLAAGPRLSPHSQAKMRCINLGTDTNFWNDFWGVKWSTFDIIGQLNFAVAGGFNSVKVYSDGLLPIQPTGNGLVLSNPYPSDAVMVQRIQWFANQCRRLGLAIYLAQNQTIEYAGIGGADMTAKLAINAKHLGWFRDFAGDLVMAVDLCNEVNAHSAGSGGARWNTNYVASGAAGALAYQEVGLLRDMGRAAWPGMPMTVSVFMANNNAYTNNGWFDLQYDLGFDFHDYHPYHGFAASKLPGVQDILGLRARTKYIGKSLQGECGCSYDGRPSYQYGTTSDGQPHPVGFQASFASGMGAAASQRDSYGANWFTLRPYNNGSTSATDPSDALCDTTLTVQYPATVAAIRSTWPGSAL